MKNKVTAVTVKQSIKKDVFYLLYFVAGLGAGLLLTFVN